MFYELIFFFKNLDIFLAFKKHLFFLFVFFHTVKTNVSQSLGHNLLSILEGEYGYPPKLFPQDFEILGWCPAGPVLPQGEKVPL